MGATKTKIKSLPEDLMGVEYTDVQWHAGDGYALHGTLFTPVAPIQGSILLSSGTGIPRTFYKAFAAYLATRGYGVLTYDFRGIGDSRPEALAGFDATKRDWGRLDMSSAFAKLQETWPDQPHYVFGHSVGGQLLMLMDRPEEIDGLVSYGSCFGYWGRMKSPYRYFVAMLWYLAIPATTSLFRYVPARRLKLGEDLPEGVATDWARWGKRPDYFTREFANHPGFRKLQCPWKAYLAVDDDIATLGNATPLYDLYPHADVDVELLTPAHLGVESLGHMEFFSRRRRDAWHIVPDWFDRLSFEANTTSAPTQTSLEA